LAANKAGTAPAEKKSLSIPPLAIVIVLLLVAGLGIFLYLNYAAQKPAPAPPALTGAARTYIHDGFLKITNADMQAHESYLKQQVVEITGKIQNTGDRILDTVEINCVFYDAYGQVVLRDRVPIVSRQMGKLAPGESKPFRLPFDNVPAGWNQVMPQMVIASIEFD
jgi:hypothetical protein